MQIITLTTDFGTSDYYVAMLKAAIYSRKVDLNLVDISHNIASYDIVEGAFFISNTFRKFPKGTIHVVAVQNYQSKQEKFICFKHEDHFFIGPNNGLFSIVFPELMETEMYYVNIDKNEYPHIQDMLAHAVAYLSHGLELNEIGEKVTDYERKLGLQPVTTSNQIRATVIHVDHFGNVIVNLTKTQFTKLRNNRGFRLYYRTRDPISSISKKYNDVPIGDVLCMFNTADYMEIAINMGDANELLGLKKNETIQIDFID